MPDPNLDRLKAVSKELLILRAAIVVGAGLVDEDEAVKLCNSIAADMLRLADENQELRELIFQVHIHDPLHPDDWPKHIHEKIKQVIPSVIKRLRGVAPASAEKRGKDEIV